MKKLAIIGAEETAQNYAIVAREIGVETHCFAWEKGAIARDSVDHFYPISIFEVDRIVEKCRDIGVDGVVATTELTISIAAQVAFRLGLNGIDPKIASQLTDKFGNREKTNCVEGLFHPRYAKIHSVAELGAADLKFPVILKPVAEGGKRGITVVRSMQAAELAIEYAANESKRGYEIIAEEFVVGGTECSVEALSFHGEHYVIQVTEKISSGAPHCVELGHIQPARISADDRLKIEQVIPRMLTALGYDNGPSHTEIKVCSGKIFLIECNTRPGGDFITYPLVNLSTGYYHLQGAIEIALSQFAPPNMNDFGHAHAGVLFVTKQTQELLPLFNRCQEFPWCCQKHDVDGEIQELVHNNNGGTRYFIWKNQAGIPDEINNWLSARNETSMKKEK